MYSHTIISFRFDLSQDRLSLPIAMMGAPIILVEKLIAGTETLASLEAVKKLLVSGVCEEANDFGRKSAGGLEVKQSSNYPGVYEATGLDRIILPEDNDLPLVWYKCSSNCNVSFCLNE